MGNWERTKSPLPPGVVGPLQAQRWRWKRATKGLPSPHVVRRFQAVIEVTGKEEAEVERFDLEVERLSDAGILHPTPIPTCSGDARQRKSSSGLLRVSDVHLRIMLMIGRKQRQMRRTRGRKGSGRRGG